ncbi:hypothetical protein EGW08_011891, partial [Elysia chlorotica]
MSQDVQRNSMANCKCAKCKSPLVDPVQLSACLHILCKSCITYVESVFLNNINCPKCGQENAKPSILNRISRIEHPKNPGRVTCDFDESHENALWNCFFCAKNFCSQCRSNHPLDHGDGISLLAPLRDIQLYGAQVEKLDVTTNNAIDNTDCSLGSSSGFLGSIGENCPMCGTNSCPHIDVLEKLHAPPEAEGTLCEFSSHKGCDGRPLPKNYFCLPCWKPVCGECSLKGDHKLHTSKNLENMKDHLRLMLCDLRKRVAILSAKAKRDREDQREVQDRLKEHAESVSKEMDRRKCKILEEVTRIFNMAVDDAEYQAKDIVRIYSKELEQTDGLCTFLDGLSSALELEVDENLNTAQYISVFNNIDKAESIVEEMRREVMNRSKPQEQRLVLCSLNMFSPCDKSVAAIGRECRQPLLSFSFKMNDEISFVHSIVVKGSDQCFISCQMISGRNYDAILHYQGECSNPVEKVIDVERGRYYISRMESGEIVASYSSENLNAIKYFESDKLLLEQGDFAEFDNTMQLQFEPRGIAATKQNTILLCVAVPQDKKGKVKRSPLGHRETSYLMLLSLQGKVLEEAQHIDTDTLSPNCVAVSDSGEICVCDPNNSTIAILDSKLKLKE